MKWSSHQKEIPYQEVSEWARAEQGFFPVCKASCIASQVTGPWRSLWVRLGYDPRKIPEAKKYQVLDFRIRCSSKHGEDWQEVESSRFWPGCSLGQGWNCPSLLDSLKCFCYVWSNWSVLWNGTSVPTQVLFQSDLLRATTSQNTADKPLNIPPASICWY